MSMRRHTMIIGALVATTGPASAACLVDQAQESWNSTSGGFRWQSFTAAEAGFLCQVDVNTAGALDGATLEIYAGEGTAGAELHAQSVDLAGEVTSIPIDAPVVVESGDVFTIHFVEIPSWRLQTGDPYAGGVGNINPDVDFWFRTHVDAMSTPTETRSWGRLKVRYASE